MPLTFQNSDLGKLVPGGPYQPEDLQRIEDALRDRGTLTFTQLPTGLFSASSAGPSIAISGYGNVWVRDNVFVAYAHAVNGRPAVAREVARALLTFFEKSRRRFDGIISGAVDKNTVSERPAVRFDGAALEEIHTERWGNAQNDALGYFVWLYARLAAAGGAELDDRAVSILTLFVRYFQAIRYWEDEDNGHWEEQRKISASSIGVVMAGLQQFLALARVQHSGFDGQVIAIASDLVDRGEAALQQILPGECAQLSPGQNRRYDGALIFLLYPLQIIGGPLADLILHDVARYLQGEIGIRRYLGDSYWAPDYEDKLAPADRTRDFSDDMATRDRLLDRIGDEAQWCLFDSILSAHHGARFAATADVSHLERQKEYLERALAQVTAEWKCPELYYMRHGMYVPNPHVPLQWTQANLMLALAAMRTSLTAAHPARGGI